MNIRRMRFMTGLCGLTLLLGVCGRASAGDEFNRPGFSVGLGANGLISGFQGVLGRAHYGNTAGFTLHGGYRLNEWIAFDGVYEYGNDFGRSGRTRMFDNQRIT